MPYHSAQPAAHRRRLAPSREHGVVAVDDEASAGPQRAEGADRRRAADTVEDDVHAVAGQLADPGQEVLVAVVDRHRAEPLDRGAVAGRRGAVEAQPGERAEFEDRDAHPPGRAVHEHRLSGLHLRAAMQHLVGGRVGQDQAHDLRRVQVLGHLDRLRLGHADVLGVAAVGGQRGDPVPDVQPRAARAELVDDADDLVAGCERRPGHAEVRAGAQLGIGQRHPRGQDPDAHLTRTRPGDLVLHHPQDLGPAEVIDDNALHGSQASPGSGQRLRRGLG